MQIGMTAAPATRGRSAPGGSRQQGGLSHALLQEMQPPVEASGDGLLL